jgi:hypothetical protein
MTSDKEDDIRKWIKEKLNTQRNLDNQILEENAGKYNIIENWNNQLNKIENSQFKYNKKSSHSNNGPTSHFKNIFELDKDLFLLMIGLLEVVIFIYLLIIYLYL